MNQIIRSADNRDKFLRKIQKYYNLIFYNIAKYLYRTLTTRTLDHYSGEYDEYYHHQIYKSIVSVGDNEFHYQLHSLAKTYYRRQNLKIQYELLERTKSKLRSISQFKQQFTRPKFISNIRSSPNHEICIACWFIMSDIFIIFRADRYLLPGFHIAILEDLSDTMFKQIDRLFFQDNQTQEHHQIQVPSQTQVQLTQEQKAALQKAAQQEAKIAAQEVSEEYKRATENIDVANLRGGIEIKTNYLVDPNDIDMESVKIIGYDQKTNTWIVVFNTNEQGTIKYYKMNIDFVWDITNFIPVSVVLSIFSSMFTKMNSRADPMNHNLWHKLLNALDYNSYESKDYKYHKAYVPTKKQQNMSCSLHSNEGKSVSEYLYKVTTSFSLPFYLSVTRHLQNLVTEYEKEIHHSIERMIGPINTYRQNYYKNKDQQI